MQPTHYRTPQHPSSDSPFIRPKVIYAVLGLLGFSTLGAVLLSPDFNDLSSSFSRVAAIQSAIGTKAKFKVSDIAGKTRAEVEQVLGKPSSSQKVAINRQGCPCEKLTYKYGQVEIVYIKGKSDWITINLPSSKVDLSGPYLVTKAYENPGFVYIQVATN